MTRLDKIKSFSIDEMARFLDEDVFGCNECKEGQELSDNAFAKLDTCSGECRKYVKMWLMEEV